MQKTCSAKINLATFLAACVVVLSSFSTLHGEETGARNVPLLVRAVMCEAIEKFTPVNEAVVFSVEREKVLCFTEFDPVPERAVIFHKWYHRGKLVSSQKLTLQPPRWSSFTSMQLRATDIGPWQVDITDDQGNMLKTLRFSITD